MGCFLDGATAERHLAALMAVPDPWSGPGSTSPSGPRRRRRVGGGLPHGYSRSGSGAVEVDPEAAADVRRAFELVCSGATVRAAAADLGWHPTMLARVLKRDEYKRSAEWRIVDPRAWNDA